MSKPYDVLWVNVLLAPCEQGYELMEKSAIAVKDGKIAWLGVLQEDAETLADQIVDGTGCCITPGFIDCHTHLVYASNRAHEFELRLKGTTYEAISLQGGGILSTVNATRAASEEQLFAESLPRAKNMLETGTTTLEIKSGYGLDLSSELKILRIAKLIGEALPLTVVKTFLGAHAIPPEFRNNADDYIQLVCEEMIPQVAQEKLADTVDVFCERIAFSPAQCEKVFIAARRYDLKVKCHADQLSNMGASILAAEYGALSVDHLEYLTPEQIPILVKNNTVAVLLPGAFYYLQEKQLPPIAALRENRVPMAIATDCNPGTSPVVSLLLILNMACTLFNLTPEEALMGVTMNAAKALGLEETHGSLSVGKVADFIVWRIKHPAELAYYVGFNPMYQLVIGGKVVMER
ncbi:MAG: imidazolonepropionase [Gammaproteobacteria bacterium]|nr:imidazolonepropionase [Gammaproteobacteria bacterium]